MKYLLGTTLALSAAVACSSSAKSPEAPAPKPLATVDAANLLASDHPLAEGQRLFTGETWGAEKLGGMPPADFLLNLMKTEPEVFGDQFSQFGFIKDPNDEFPVGLKRGTQDPSLVHETCVACHVAPLPDGKLWIGMPNVKIDMQRFRLEVDKRWVAAGHESMLTPMEISKIPAVGPGRFNMEAGQQPRAIPVVAPMMWNLGKRKQLEARGNERNVHASIWLAFYLGFRTGNPDEASAKVPFPAAEKLDALVAYLSSIDPPPAPAQDSARITSGKAVFEKAKCGTCHHIGQMELDDVVQWDASKERVPGEDPAFPRGTVSTCGDQLNDVNESTSLGTENGGIDPLIRFIVTNGLKVHGTDGFRVVDMRGLWAKTPYLHNASVPTLEDLLKPAAERPKSYDLSGFRFDTSVSANRNVGHEFGTTLPDNEKSDLIAYLRSL